MELLLELVEKYNLYAVILALVSIFLVGCVKVVFGKGFKRMGNGAKTIYEVLSTIFSAGVAVLWICVAPWFGLPAETFTIEGVAKLAAVVYSIVKILYPIYENYRLRDLVCLIGKLGKGLFVHKSTKKKEEDNKNKILVI